MTGSMSAISTDLPRTSAANVTDTDVPTEIPVRSSISLRMIATRWSATKKKIAGGSIALISSLIIANDAFMGLAQAISSGSLNSTLRPRRCARTALTCSLAVAEDRLPFLARHFFLLGEAQVEQLFGGDA